MPAASSGMCSDMLQALIVAEDCVTAGVLSELARSESYQSLVIDRMSAVEIQSTHSAPDLIFLSCSLPDVQFNQWLERFVPALISRIVLMGAAPPAEVLVGAFRQGIADFLLEPVDTARVRHLLRQRKARLAEDNARTDMKSVMCAPVVVKPVSAPELLGDSPAMKTLRHQVDRVAPTEASVLLLGESGTGKELVAQTIHCHSGRRRQAFLPVNCGAISPQLIESEIFGHEKGSFTGADRQHKGYFERASGGTLFLDEVIEMPIDLQVKLLRVLETGTFMRIGSSQELKTDVRIIAATNRDPEAAIARGRLRLDLYHRLNVFPLKVPPMRERGSDIDLIAQYFLDELNAKHGTCKQMSARALASLRHYHWPGNVRELKNFIQRAYILADQFIDMPAPERSQSRSGSAALTLAVPVGTSLADADRKLIFATLELCGGVKKRAADLLGISLKTLYNRLEEYGHPGKNLALMDSSKAPNASNTSLRIPGRDCGLLN